MTRNAVNFILAGTQVQSAANEEIRRDTCLAALSSLNGWLQHAVKILTHQ
jgi:hypothetical protein